MLNFAIIKFKLKCFLRHLNLCKAFCSITEVKQHFAWLYLDGSRRTTQVVFTVKIKKISFLFKIDLINKTYEYVQIERDGCRY